MKPRYRGRVKGAAFLVAILSIMVVLAMTGSMVSVWVSSSHAMTASLERNRAFNLAESGLEEAKWELGEDDEGQDNVLGAASGSSAQGSYSVSAADLGSGYQRLTSVAASGGTTVTLEETVRVGGTSRFPGGAISVVGGMDTTQILFGSSTDLLIDGGDSPGLVFSDGSTYDTASSQFVSGVSSGYVQESDVVGSVTNTFQPGNVDLSIQELPPEETSISIYASLWTDLRSQVNTVYLPSAAAQTLPGSGNATYGTAGSPVQYWFPADQKIKGGQTISGHGTLLFNRNMIVEAGGTLNWNGNIVVFGENSFDVFFDIDGQVNVTGNIIVVGSSGRNARFSIKGLGQVTVNGALTVLTEYANSATQMQFLVDNDLTVNGLITTVAARHQTEFKPGSDVSITGSFQVGRLDGSQSGTELKMKFEDQIEIHKDDGAIAQGADALVSLGGNIGSALGDALTRTTVTTEAWRVVPES